MHEKYLTCKETKFKFKKGEKYLTTFYSDGIVVCDKYVFTIKSKEHYSDFYLTNIYSIFYSDAELRLIKLKKIYRSDN